MSAIANIVLNNGEATPIAKTFSPVNIDATGVAKWSDRSNGVAIGMPAITFALKNPTKDSRVYRVTAKVTVPVLEQTSPSTATGIQPAPTLAYNLIANMEFVLPERSTLAQRKDLVAFARNYLANAAVITAAIENFESVY
jgi:hypothetical protein